MEPPSADPSATSSSQSFGWALTVALIFPAALVFICLLALRYARPEQWSPGAIYGSLAVSIGSTAAIISVAIAGTRLARRAGSRTIRNIFLTTVGVLALLPTIFIAVVVVIALIRVA